MCRMCVCKYTNVPACAQVVPQPEFPSSGLMLNTSVMPPNMTMNMSMMQRLQAQRKYEREEHARFCS